MVVYTVTWTVDERRDQGFKTSPSYIESLISAQAVGNLSQNKHNLPLLMTAARHKISWTKPEAREQVG